MNALFLAALLQSSPPSSLIDATSEVPDLTVDLRYATPDNFLKRAVYPPGARCLVLPELARRLVVAAKALRQRGYRLQAWDCYRPFSVQKQMWELFPHRGYVADPGRGGSHHNRGAAVDVTLLTKDGAAVEMPTPFDTFTRAAHLRYDGGTRSSRVHRDTLVAAMEEAGFKLNPMEWWHFELIDAPEYAVLDVPLGP